MKGRYRYFECILYLLAFGIIISCDSDKNNKFSKEILLKETIISSNEGEKLKLENIVLEDENSSSIFNEKNHIVYFFPISVCDVCEVDVFKQINNIPKIKEDIIVLIPIKNLRDFKRFNDEYDMNIISVFGYREEILQMQNNFLRGSFFELSKQLIISNLYIPEKPINKEKFYNNFKR